LVMMGWWISLEFLCGGGDAAVVCGAGVTEEVARLVFGGSVVVEGSHEADVEVRFRVRVRGGVRRVVWRGQLCVVCYMLDGKVVEVLFRSAVFWFHHWFSITTATNASSLSQAVAFLWSRLWFRFKPASLPAFCCWISSSSRFMFVWLLVSW
jgi:hypothetical protein